MSLKSPRAQWVNQISRKLSEVSPRSICLMVMKWDNIMWFWLNVQYWQRWHWVSWGLVCAIKRTITHPVQLWRNMWLIIWKCNKDLTHKRASFPVMQHLKKWVRNIIYIIGWANYSINTFPLKFIQEFIKVGFWTVAYLCPIIMVCFVAIAYSSILLGWLIHIITFPYALLFA